MTNFQTIFSKKGTYYLLLLFLAIAYTLIYFTSVSPLVEDHAIDGSMFIAMGKMFKDGLVPYVDFFDHKGPVIVYIHAIGQCIASGRMGIFILEIVNLFFVLVLVDRFLSMFFENKKMILSIISFLFLYLILTLGGGNFTEEVSFIPMILSLHIGCKYFFFDRQLTSLQAFVLGVCLSFFFWLRITNGAVLYAVALFIIICSIQKKDFKSLKNLFLYGFLGFLQLTLSTLLYFYHHDAVYDLFYGTFLFNMKYATNPPAKIFHPFAWINALVLLFIGVGSYLYYKETKDKQIFLLSALVFFISYFAINTAYLYRHYFMIYFPALLYGLMLVGRSLKKEKMVNWLFVVMALTFVVITITGINSARRKNKRINPVTKEYSLSVDEILAKIPVEEQSKTYYYSILPRFYTLSGVNSNYKYFVLQEWMGQHDPNILKEINEMMVSPERPLWVVVEKAEIENIDNNDDFKAILKKDYSLEAENKHFLLYQAK